MPPPVDLTGLIASIDSGFAAVADAISASQTAVDLTDLTAEVKRVADALYVYDIPSSTDVSITQAALESNLQVRSVIGLETGVHRVRTDPA